MPRGWAATVGTGADLTEGPPERVGARGGAPWSACRCCLSLCLAAVLTAPVCGQSWHAELTVTSGAAARVLVFGQHPEATPGIDPELGEEELPPLPPLGIPDVRFLGAALGNGSPVDLRAWDAARTDTLTVLAQSAAGAARVLTWDAAHLAACTSLAALTDLYGGMQGVVVDMRAVGELRIQDARIERLWLIVRSAKGPGNGTGGARQSTWGEVKAAF